MAKTPFFTGKGVELWLAALPDGIETEPTEFTATASAAAKGATTITVTPALPADSFVPKDSYINAVSALGYEVLVQLDADADAGDTSLSVKPLPEAIVAGSTVEYPLKLRARTTADLDRSGNRVTTVTFDDDAYESGRTTTISIGLNMQGNWSPLDAGYATAEHWFNEGYQQLYFWMQLPNPRPTVYSKGKVYKGTGSITSMPLSAPADGIITGNIDAAFNGKPSMVNPTAIV